MCRQSHRSLLVTDTPIPDDTQEAINHWRALSKERLEWADYQDSRGEHSKVTRLNAKTYENTARSMELAHEFGYAFCVCHLVKSADCPRLYNPKGQR